MPKTRNTPSEWAELVDANLNRDGDEFLNTIDMANEPMGDSRVIRVTDDEIVFLRYAQYPMPDRLVFLKYDPQTSVIELFATNAEGLITI